MTDSARLHCLDGIRGWAALSVLLFHAFFEMFRGIHPEYASPFLYPFINGNFAVVVFFVLSGQALSIAYIQTRDIKGLINLTVKRYPRLAIPVFISCLIVLGILLLGLNANQEAAAIVHREGWLGSWLNFKPGFIAFFKEVLWNTFFTPERPIYNRFLWTMFYEVIGSIIVFATLFFYAEIKKPLLLFVPLAAMLFFISPYLGCFVIGMIASELHVRGIFALLKERDFWKIGTFVLLPVSYLLIIWAYVTVGQNVVLDAIIAFVLIAAVQINPLFEHAMNTKLSQFLGRISFPLYLMHFIVIVTATSWLTVALGGDGISLPESFGIGLFTVLVSLVAAYLFLPVERLTAIVCIALTKVGQH